MKTIPLNPAEEDSLEKPLWLPLDKKYAHPPASVIHPVMGRGIYHDTDPQYGTFSYMVKYGKLRSFIEQRTIVSFEASLHKESLKVKELYCKKNHREIILIATCSLEGPRRVSH